MLQNYFMINISIKKLFLELKDGPSISEIRQKQDNYDKVGRWHISVIL